MSSEGIEPPLATTFGAIVLGTFFSAILYGFTLQQTYKYFRIYWSDRISLKILVSVMLFFDTAQMALAMHTSYTYLVNHFNDPAALLIANWSLQLSALVTIGPPLLSNGFYLSRLWIIGTTNIIFMLVIGALMLTRLTFQLALAVLVWIHPVIALYQKYLWMVQAYCGASLIADILLATVFSYTLHRRRTGYSRTDKKLDLLMVYSINTGTSTSLLCLASMISLVLLERGMVYVALHYILGKLYVNSVLSVLNSRKPKHKPDDSIFELAAFENPKASYTRPARIVFRKATATDPGSPTEVSGMIPVNLDSELSNDTQADTELGTNISGSTVRNSSTRSEFEKSTLPSPMDHRVLRHD